MYDKSELPEVREKLQTFLDTFDRYSKEIYGKHRQGVLDRLRTDLQRRQPEVTKILLEFNDPNIIFRVGSFGQMSNVRLQDLLPTALLGGNNELTFNFADYKAAVQAVLNRSIGMIDSGNFPLNKPKPVLVIRDKELINRCFDLLSAPGGYDRVIRESTLILEERIRNKPPRETLIKLIPTSADQIGEKLVDKLFDANQPVIVVSSDKQKRIAFYKILVGIFSYLRNPYHHHIDPTIEWSWAWSIVGFIDNLLEVIDNCQVAS